MKATYSQRALDAIEDAPSRSQGLFQASCLPCAESESSIEQQRFASEAAYGSHDSFIVTPERQDISFLGLRRLILLQVVSPKQVEHLFLHVLSIMIGFLFNLDKVQECLTMFQCQALITAKTSKKTLFRSCGTIECLRCNCHLLLQPNKF